MVIEQDITGRETPHARPNATLLFDREKGVLRARVHQKLKLGYPLLVTGFTTPEAQTVCLDVPRHEYIWNILIFA